MKKQLYSPFDIIIQVTFVVLFFTAGACVITEIYNANSCYQSAKIMGVDFKYQPFTGCFVKEQGGYYPMMAIKYNDVINYNLIDEVNGQDE